MRSCISSRPPTTWRDRNGWSGRSPASRPSWPSGSPSWSGRGACLRRSGCACGRPTTSRCSARWEVAPGSRTTHGTSTAVSPGARRIRCSTISPRTSCWSSTSRTPRCRRSAPCTRVTRHGSGRSSNTGSGCRARSTTARSPGMSFASGSARPCTCPPPRAPTNCRGAGGDAVEQVIRPPGLIDPQVIIKQTKGQIDDLVHEIRERADRNERVLVTTLTKKMSEDLTDYLLELGIRARYLHSEVDTLRRVELLRELRLGEYDVLVGINLLREGLDLPEVSLV